MPKKISKRCERDEMWLTWGEVAGLCSRLDKKRTYRRHGPQYGEEVWHMGRCWVVRGVDFHQRRCRLEPRYKNETS